MSSTMNLRFFIRSKLSNNGSFIIVVPASGLKSLKELSILLMQLVVK